MEQTGSAILLTRSERGMSYFAPGMPPVHLPTFAREVFDVSGAGDTVVATFALAMAGRMPVPQALNLANHAAGIAVSKPGTVTVSAADLAAAMSVPPGVRYRRTLATSRAEAAALCIRWRRAGLRIGLTNGCFDLLHPGHVSLIGQLAQECDRVVVAVNTDASVRRLKGPLRPVQDQDARAQVVCALASVDLVVLFDEDTPYETIKALRPDVLCKGMDYSEDEVVGADIVKAAGGRVLLAALVEGQSTTSLIRRSARPA
jgi:D-beta-D-heptose 7-phosphate kinase/D-beta-D-heptose 1-phosphate adenosyltransferase